MTDVTKTYQICVLGSGPAGQTIAVDLARRGFDVIVLENRQLGGTCALRGCNPKKVLANGARLVDAANRVRGRMTIADPIELDWPTIHRFQNEFTEPVTDAVLKKFETEKIDFEIGSPKFVSPTEIEVNGRIVVANHVVLATGAKPIELAFPGGEHVTTSDEFLNLEKLPASILFVGGGYISMEFAHVAVRCGSQATVVDRNPRILGHFDADLVEQLTQYSIDSGIEIVREREVFKIERLSSGSLAVTIGKPTDGESEQTRQSTPRTIVVEMVVHGAGRSPNLDGLNLESVDIKTSSKGLRTDRYGRCDGFSHIYAVGDCADSGLAALTPTAEYEGKTVLKNLLVDLGQGGEMASIDPGPVTAVAFTPVPIASVGLSQEDAKKQISKLRVSHDDTSSWGSIRKTGQRCAGYKILIDDDSDKIVGCICWGRQLMSKSICSHLRFALVCQRQI